MSELLDHIVENSQQYMDTAIQFTGLYTLKILVALLIFFVGRKLVRVMTNLVVKALERKGTDLEFIGFVDSFMYWALLAIVIVISLSQVGVETASLIAILGAASLAVGLALQGSLSNFAAGVLIILLRPFKVGDIVDAAGETGKVDNIKIFTTVLRTADNKCVIIPNARVLDSNIINHSSTGTRRVDLIFGVGYEADIDIVRAEIETVLAAEKRILDEPATQIAVLELADSSVNFAVRPWVKSSDYWNVYFNLQESIKKKFDDVGISIPFPQRDIHYVPRGEQPRAGEPRGEQPRPEEVRSEETRGEQLRPEEVRSEETRSDETRGEENQPKGSK